MFYALQGVLFYSNNGNPTFAIASSDEMTMCSMCPEFLRWVPPQNSTLVPVPESLKILWPAIISILLNWKSVTFYFISSLPSPYARHILIGHKRTPPPPPTNKNTSNKKTIKTSNPLNSKKTLGCVKKCVSNLVLFLFCSHFQKKNI